MISVVIPAYNEEENISRCLEALCNQTTKMKFEVIVVNNNSTDNTSRIAQTFNDRLNLKVITQQRKGRSPARKKGFDHVIGDLIFSTDSDCEVPNDWIEKLYNPFKDEKIVAVTGSCYIDDCGSLTNKIFNLIQPAGMRFFRIIFGHYWLSGFSFAIRKEAYKKSGGFDPHLNIQEDIDLSFKVAKVGKIKFISDTPIHFSSRRIKEKGLIRGLLPYFTSFWYYYTGNKEMVYLSDVR